MDKMNGGKGRGGARKMPFSPALGRNGINGLAVGQDVAVRWSDGLLYQGNIMKVDEANGRCQVKFEDGSMFYVLFKDAHKVPGSGETSCCVCKGEGSSDSGNQITTCDNCGMGYHQCCHNPPLAKDMMELHGMFFCRLCTFAASVKEAGTGKLCFPVAGTDDLKQIQLPYKMNLLTWDAQHRTNVEQCYCYCGGPGDWFCKMLQCCRCRQWFHEACVVCLQYPMVYGDRFYVFVCAHCNLGQEYVKRLSFKWVDVAQLALFNLTLQHSHKYHDLDDVLLPWIAQHQHHLALDSLLQGKSMKSKEVRNKLESALMGHKSKFTSGREVKKKNTLWALVLRVPPVAPSVVVPLLGPVNTDVLDNPGVIGRRIKHVSPTRCHSPIPLKFPSRSGLDRGLSIMFKNIVASKVIPEANNNHVMNGCRMNPSHHLVTSMLNGTHTNDHNSHAQTSSSESSSSEEDLVPCQRKKLPRSRFERGVCRRSLEKSSCKAEPPTSPSKETSSSVSSPCLLTVPRSVHLLKTTCSVLDRLVNKLPDFVGMNNPFCTEVEKEVERERLKHVETRMAYLKKEYAGELAAMKLAQTVKLDAGSQEKGTPAKPPPATMEQRLRRGVKQKHSPTPEEDDSVRRSKRCRMSAERYQHLLQSFPSRMPKREAGVCAMQRWKWKSLVDQLRYGEKFQISACRTTPQGRLEFLLHWYEDEKQEGESVADTVD